MAQNALIVKSRFQFKASGLYGLMALIFDNDKKILVEDHIYASRFSELFNVDIKMPWSMLEIQLNAIQMKGSYASSISGEFKRTLRERFDPNYGIAAGIVVDYELRNREKIHSTLEEILTFVQKDKGVSIETAYELGDLDQINAARAQRSAEETQKMLELEALQPPTNPVVVNSDEVFIPASPVLSPIHGIPSVELIPGMKILMKLDGSTPEGLQWAQIFKAFHPETKDFIPIVATITQAGPVFNKCRDIVVHYGNRRVTRFNVETSIKIKVYDVFSKEKVAYPHLLPETHTEGESIKSTGLLLQSILLWAVFGVITACAVTIIFYLVFSF